jgi:uncharacterized membrane protein YoaK (UPF0700 family)
LLLFLAGAMGLQTATLTRIGPLTVHTTFVTGMINKFCQLVSHALFLSVDVLRGREGARVIRRQVTRRAAYIFSIWLLYLVGAMVGAHEESPLGMRSLFVPIAVLAAAIIVDQLWPFAVQEEQDQG